MIPAKTGQGGHIPVLLQETVGGLELKDGEVVLDATSGSGGHAEALLARLGKEGTIVCMDQDDAALIRSKARLAELPGKKIFICGNFRNLVELLAREGITYLDGALFDLGMSSEQIEASGKGFSFLRDEPLLMTMSQDAKLTAEDLVMMLSEDKLADILYGYGEEHFAKRIAAALVAARKKTPIKTSAALAQIVGGAVPFWYRHRRIHPATKTFQALRIAVNDEYSALDEGLKGANLLLREGGRLAVIAFHGGEVRRIKSFFGNFKEEGLIRVNKKAIMPSRTECMANPRARSARLFIFKKREQL